MASHLLCISSVIRFIRNTTIWLDDPRFDKLFTLAILFPVAPDDALCLMASLTNMSFKKYSAIIFLAKPASIFLYSLALLQGGALLEKLLLH